MIMAFLSSFSTVSEGWAPTDSHFLIAGAFRLVSFRRGSYQPSSCARIERGGEHGCDVSRVLECTKYNSDPMTTQSEAAGWTAAERASSGRPSRFSRWSMAMTR